MLRQRGQGYLVGLKRRRNEQVKAFGSSKISSKYASPANRMWAHIFVAALAFLAGSRAGEAEG
jgi:hypothetical protein